MAADQQLATDNRQLVERRRAARRAPALEEPVCRVRLRTGRELSVVDVSSGGALVEGARLLPGTHVDVHIMAREGRVLVRSHVVRAWVVDVQASAVRYRGALAFDRPIDTSQTSQSEGYAMPSRPPAHGEGQGNLYPSDAFAAAGRGEHRLTA